MARIETMACRLVFGRCGSGSGRSSASREAAGTAPGLDSAFHIVTSGWSGPDGPVWMPWDSPGGMERVRRHPRPPQLPLPVRRLFSDAVAGYRPRPFLRLPTGGLSKLSDERFETSGAPSGPFDEFPQLQVFWTMVRTLGCSRPSTGRVPATPKMAISSQLIDMKQINPSGRLSD